MHDEEYRRQLHKKPLYLKYEEKFQQEAIIPEIERR
jgi:hypothetical protein